MHSSMVLVTPGQPATEATTLACLPAFAEAALQVLSDPSPTLREAQRLEFVHLMCFSLEALDEALPVSAWRPAAPVVHLQNQWCTCRTNSMNQELAVSQ